MDEETEAQKSEVISQEHPEGKGQSHPLYPGSVMFCYMRVLQSLSELLTILLSCLPKRKASRY